MAMQRGRARGYPPQRRNATDWGRIVIPNATVASGTKVLLATFVLSNPGISETVRRTRGRFAVLSDQGAVIEQQNGAIGLIVVSDLAIAAGVASIPGPVTDASDDGWFVWEGFTQVSRQVLGGSVDQTGYPYYEFDSKAMRKVADGFGIAVVAEALSQGTSIGLVVSLLGSRT